MEMTRKWQRLAKKSYGDLLAPELANGNRAVRLVPSTQFKQCKKHAKNLVVDACTMHIRAPLPPQRIECLSMSQSYVSVAYRSWQHTEAYRSQQNASIEYLNRMPQQNASVELPSQWHTATRTRMSARSPKAALCVRAASAALWQTICVVWKRINKINKN